VTLLACGSALLGVGVFCTAKSVSAGQTPLQPEDKWFHSDQTTDYYDYFPSAASQRTWQQGGATEERLQDIAIPAPVLKTISTRGLAETVLNYPMQIDLWMYDTPAMAIRAVSEQFNGIGALASRKDAPATLLAIYEDVSVAQVVEASDSPMIEFTTLQYLLADDGILDRLGSDGRRELIQTALARYREIAADDHLAEQVPVDATLWLIARAAAVEFPESSEVVKAHPALADYLKTGQLVADDDEIKAIEQKLAQLLEGNGYGKFLQDS
jgi:hypothetical protein